MSIVTELRRKILSIRMLCNGLTPGIKASAFYGALLHTLAPIRCGA